MALTKSVDKTLVVPYQMLRTWASLNRFGRPVLYINPIPPKLYKHSVITFKTCFPV